ncbi:hypothetical protein ACFSO7_06055 [Bacillus sp. CGMCC 1.16607]|uniref:hypothetical protein n=1 Tax=Bacillus sp. CGMCC 1.16607 TaxID=3351842 RepID=UPI00362F546A
MSTFFIIISLLLNFVAFFVILILFQRQNKLFEVEKNQEKLVKEMEEVIASYLMEMKEDNERFIEKINQINQSRNMKVESKVEEKRQSQHTYSEESAHNKLTEKLESTSARPVYAVSRVQIANAYKQNQYPQIKKDESNSVLSDIPINTNGIETVSIKKSILEEILLLQNQGYSEEEIAKKLNKGKTEIQLLLKFQQND